MKGRFASSSDAPSSCPCCQFRLPDGLFLPSESGGVGVGVGGDHNDLPGRQQERGSSRRTRENKSVGVAEDSEPFFSESLSPQDAFEIILDRHRDPQGLGFDSGGDEFPAPLVCVVDTHCHAHLERVTHSSTYALLPDGGEGREMEEPESDGGTAELLSTRPPLPTISLSCAVSPSDWDACLEYAAASSSRIPALGVHPWYLDEILANGDDGDLVDSNLDRMVHAELGESSPQPSLASTVAAGDWLKRLKSLLLDHPGCLVGEIGLCKQAKFLRTHPGGKAEALALQREVFRAQLRLACQLGRAASIHCVNQHGVLLDVFRSLVLELLENQRNQETLIADPGSTPALYLPPAMALHSFTGTAHQVRQLLAWEADLPPSIRFRGGPNRTNESRGPSSSSPTSLPPLLYFGFSHIVNVAMCTSDKSRRQGQHAILEVPTDRWLAESDVSSSRDVVGGTVGAIAYLASVGATAAAAAATTTTMKTVGPRPGAHEWGAQETLGLQSSSSDCEAGGVGPTSDNLLRIAKLTSENGIRFLRQQQQQQLYS